MGFALHTPRRPARNTTTPCAHGTQETPTPRQHSRLRRLPEKEKRGRPAGAAAQREVSAPLAVGLAPGADVWHQLMSFLPGKRRC